MKCEICNLNEADRVDNQYGAEIHMCFACELEFQEKQPYWEKTTAIEAYKGVMNSDEPFVIITLDNGQSGGPQIRITQNGRTVGMIYPRAEDKDMQYWSFDNSTKKLSEYPKKDNIVLYKG